MSDVHKGINSLMALSRGLPSLTEIYVSEFGLVRGMGTTTFTNLCSLLTDVHKIIRGMIWGEDNNGRISQQCYARISKGGWI